MKIAIIGVGQWGRNLLKEFDKQTEIVWICHKDSDESAKFLAENYPNTKTTNSLEDILRDSEVGAVVVTTPTDTHFEIAKKVLETDKHLFLEKPGCSNSHQFKILHEEARKRNLKLAVGYEFAHHPVFKKIKELISITDIESLHFEWNKWGTFEAPIIPHLLSHDISIIKSLGIDSLILKSCKKQQLISPVDIINVEFENDKNISIISYINRVSKNKNKSVTFIGKEKSYLWNNDDLFEIDIKNKNTTPINISNTGPVTEEIRDFLESIEENKKPLTDGKFASDIWKIVDKISN